VAHPCRRSEPGHHRFIERLRQTTEHDAWPVASVVLDGVVAGASTAGSVAFVFYSGNRDSAAALVSTLVAVATAAVSAAAWLW